MRQRLRPGQAQRGATCSAGIKRATCSQQTGDSRAALQTCQQHATAEVPELHRAVRGATQQSPVHREQAGDSAVVALNEEMAKLLLLLSVPGRGPARRDNAF